MDSIRKIIERAVTENADKNIVFEDDGFLFGLFDEYKDKHRKSARRRFTSKILNFLLIFCSTVTGIVILVNICIFLIHDVLLFQNKALMNGEGAFVPMQSCNRENVLFLFTSSDLWANTGIQVHKGDRIKISASGSFNSSISKLREAAEKNFKLRYPWVSTWKNEMNEQGQGVENCIYTGEGAYFGSVLYQIESDVNTSPDNLCRKNNPYIHQLNQKDGEVFKEVGRNGTIYFAVNDIYLRDDVIDSILEKDRRYLKAQGIVGDTITKAQWEIHKDSLQLYRKVEKDAGNYVVSGQKLKDRIAKDRKLWFYDNAGDILICMEVEHQLEAGSDAYWFRTLESKFTEVLDTYRNGEHGNILSLFGGLLWAFVEAVALSLWHLKKFILGCLFFFFVVNLLYIVYRFRHPLRRKGIRKFF